MLVILLLFATLLKGLVWSAVIPVWHTPDESSHFAQAAYFAEFDKMPKGKVKDKSKEILLSERLLGTERDEKGNNKFTYHPEYRIEYSDNFLGIYENEIKSFPQSYRQEMIKQETPRYPPLFYAVGGLLYRLFYNFDLITRIYAVRLVSILSLFLMTFFAYKIGLEVFKDKISALSLSILVSFQPMNTFISGGVTSDSLGNLLFSIIIFLCLKIMTGKDIFRYTILSAVSLGLAMYTKPQSLVAFSFIIFAYAIAVFSKKVSLKKTVLIAPFFLLFVYFFGGHLVFQKMMENWKEVNNPLPYIETQTTEDAAYMTFPNFLAWTLKHTVSEVFPWYWGVFNWLGVVLPRVVNQIIVRITLFSILGLIFYFLKIIKNKKIPENILPVIFMLFTSLIFFLAITVMDYAHFKSHNFSLGIQGRYFFPTIISHMALLLLGFKQFLSPKIIAYLMVVLNFIALKTVYSAYYTNLTQVSQYKPDIFKGYNIVVVILIYLLLLTYFLYKFIRLKGENIKIS